MAITMYQSDRNVVSPTNDASLYSGLVDDSNGTLNRGTQFAVTVNGLVATIGTGQAVIQGRLVEITQSEALTLPANSSGYIAIAVDLTKTNDVSGKAGDASYLVKVNQAYLVTVTGTLTQDDLNNGGFLYELPIASFTSTTTSATTTVIRSIFNDTGWKNMTLAAGAQFNGKSQQYAEYRIKNGMAIINFDGINGSGSANGNQIIKLTPDLQPKTNNNRPLFFPIANIDDNTGNYYPTTAVIQPQGGGSVIYCSWNTKNFGTKSLTHATGTIIYPIN